LANPINPHHVLNQHPLLPETSAVDIAPLALLLHIAKMAHGKSMNVVIMKVAVVAQALIVKIAIVAQAATAWAEVPAYQAPRQPSHPNHANPWKAALHVVPTSTDHAQLAPVKVDPSTRNRAAKANQQALANRQLLLNPSARKYHHRYPSLQPLNRSLRSKNAISNCPFQLSSMVFAHASRKK